MPESTTNLLLIAALGAGGVWLYHDREKHRRSAANARDNLELAVTERKLPRRPTDRATPVSRPLPQPSMTEPPARSERRKLAPRSYDSVFAEYGHGVPVAYLRALALRESALNPRLNDGPAWGLLQVVEIVRKDFNERHNTRYERRDLLNPAVNVAIGSDVLSRIIDGYARFHPEATNLQADWANPLFVELLTFGWNAGFSERGGVGRVASYLTARGLTDFTVDDVFANARQVGVSPNLANPRKVAFAKRVARQFLRERARDDAEGYQADAQSDPDPQVVAVVQPPADEPVSSPSQVDQTGGV